MLRVHFGELDLEKAPGAVAAAVSAGRLLPRLSDAGSGGGLRAGLEAVVATPGRRVPAELALLDRVVGAPAWTRRLAETETRKELVTLLREYHRATVEPYEELMRPRVEAARAAHCRGLPAGGVEGLLSGLGPAMRWERPVLYVDYRPSVDRDLYLGGRGMLLVPSYFNWQRPVTLADPGLPPLLIQPAAHGTEATATLPDGPPEAPLTILLGRARAAVLHAVSAGATAGEIARAAGVSASSASRHATALRDAGAA